MFNNVNIETLKQNTDSLSEVTISNPRSNFFVTSKIRVSYVFQTIPCMHQVKIYVPVHEVHTQMKIIKFK